MLYPKRAIVPEPFVDQLDMVEKLLIEVQHQPSNLYTYNKRKHFNGRPRYAAGTYGGAYGGAMYSTSGMGSASSGVQGPSGIPAMSTAHHHHNHFSSTTGADLRDQPIPARESASGAIVSPVHYPMVFDPFAGDQNLAFNGLKQSSSIWGSDEKRVVGDATVWG